MFIRQKERVFDFKLFKNSKKTLDKLKKSVYNSVIKFKRGAGLAQLVEQLICNQQVVGSSPI